MSSQCKSTSSTYLAGSAVDVDQMVVTSVVLVPNTAHKQAWRESTNMRLSLPPE